MKTRIEHLESKMPEQDPEHQIVQLATRWRSLIWQQSEFKKALEIRKQAEPLLKAHPELREPPKGLSKALYIDWEDFINYTAEPARNRFLEKVVTNNFKPKPETDG